MTAVAQRSFSGGEISPSLYARVDVAKYATALRTCRNFTVQKQGGASNRPGMEFIVETKDSAAGTDRPVRLVPFIFNADQTYVLLFGHLTMRVIRLGAQLTVSGVAAWNIATPYVVGDLVVDGGINYYCIAANLGQTPPNTTYWYALDGDTYEIPTPYESDDLATLQFVQSADVITLVHPDYAPRELTRTGHTTWVLSVITFAPAIAAPTNVNVSGATGTADRWVVTSIDAETFEESLASSVVGSSTVASSGSPRTLSWTSNPDAGEYNVYKYKNGRYCFIGVAAGTSFIDNGITPDETETPPTARNPFAASGDWPSCVTYYQQRRGFANTDNNPETAWFSRSGHYKNFTVSSPLQDDDAVTFTLAGREVNAIQQMLDLEKLILFTTGSEVSAEGDAAGVLKPTDINTRTRSYNGSGTLAPIVVGSSALYIQNRGDIVRELVNDAIEGYKGNDLTIFAAHLFEGHTLSDWAFQKNPQAIVWAVRDDGLLLGMTYLREHQVLAWHRHDTAGLFENVCVVPEGDEDALYVVVNRTVNGTDHRYVERMYTRRVDDIVDAVFLDSALTYDGRNTGATTMTLSGGTTWAYDETLTLTASASFFTAGDVGNQIILTDATGDPLRCTITGYTSATEVSVTPHKTVPVDLRNASQTIWTRAVDRVEGLDHLEGMAVGIFADANVVGSPNNPAYTQFVVSGGAVDLDQPYGVIHVGLGYLCDLQTLDIDTAVGETVADKLQLITRLTMHVEESRGIWVGAMPPEENPENTLEDASYGLFEAQQRNQATGYDEPVSLLTEKVDVNFENGWNSHGRVFIRQLDPLPVTLLSAIPTGEVPFRG